MATLPNLARDLKSVDIEDENGSSDEELDDSLMAVGDPQTRRMTSGPRREQMPGLGPSNEDDCKAWVPEDNDPSLLEEVQPACDLEENDLQREEGRVAIAGRRTDCILKQNEKEHIKALVDDYLHRPRFGRIVFLQNLINFFRYKRRSRLTRRYVQEMCTVIADLFIPYLMNHSHDSQNSDQVHEALLDLISAGCRGCMTARKILRELQQIFDDLVIQQGEGNQGPQPDKEVQPACDLERNDLQRGEGHVAIAPWQIWTDYILSQKEEEHIKALMDYYLHRSGFGCIVFLYELLKIFHHAEYTCMQVGMAFLVKEMCKVVADLFISYSMKNSQDSQNSDQVHTALLDLISAGCRGRRCMTAQEFLQKLQRILYEAVKQAVEQPVEQADEDLFRSYSMNNSQDSQNSDQVHIALLDLISAGCRGRRCMTAQEFLQKLQRILYEAVKQAVEQPVEQADEDLFRSYSMNSSQDSQNSDQVHMALPYLCCAVCRGITCMTAQEFLQKLQRILYDEEEAEEEEADEEEAEEEEADEVEADEEEADEEEADLVIQQGEADLGPQPDSPAPVSKHGGVDDSGPDPAAEPGNASDSQGQQGSSRKFV